MKKIGVLDNSVELLFADADGPLEAAAGGGAQLYPVTKPRPCVAPVLDLEELPDNEEVVLSISGGILPVPKPSFEIDRF